LSSHSHSVESYHTWQTTSGSTTPVRAQGASPASPNLPTDFPCSTHPTLPVHTSIGIKNLPCLVSPRNHANQRVRYVIYEYDELIDSSEAELADFVRIAQDIERNYASYHAFLVLFGTDTMAYAASALSFLLEDLGKTVIVTGAQIPLSELRNDAVDNLLGALAIARAYLIPEVTLYFNEKLYRGNRTQKTSSFAFNAFDSPNLDPLAVAGIDIEARWDLICMFVLVGDTRPQAGLQYIHPVSGRYVPTAA
jgi:lysophospholipase